MDEKTKASYEQKSKHLRADLKKWENDWAAAHGSKPGRQDIKNNADIATKYKEYNKTRDILAGKIPVPSAKQHHPPNPKKRRPEPPPVETPFKKNKYAETPVKGRTLDYDDQLMSTPAISRKLFSPAPVTCIGPTPQRDGKVLGLFDLLVSKELGTPSKTAAADGTLLPPPPTTPGGGRRRSMDDGNTPSSRESADGGRKLGRTPMSSSKRHMLNSFMTPLKNRDDDGEKTTPACVSRLQFDTPAFLRRHSALPPAEAGADAAAAAAGAPAPLRLPRKPLGRGLSEIIASLRRVEDDTLDDDDDMAALREAEGLGSAPRPATAPARDSEILARDREVARLPLGGFDDEGMHDSPDEEEDRPGGPPRVAFKKKGQKRTTRRVNMRPTITRRPTAPLDDSQDVVVDGEENGAAAAADNDEDGDYEEGAGGASSGSSSKKPAKEEGVVKKSVRKVNELAHANFRRLKLRSKNMKGKPGGFGRKFGRR
ncbi:DNA replication/checkpoint protein [Cordyceps fumosorosea ARSEF 2679]|uniref:DNA replication regulator SLD2 n=1 Tax=Cordyceps fumosorosea (strain ARSEF 2679) TaxID=1081104 RepID=A0A168CPT4_CORFA|nr:DNA replication/checkpoint protein [Cordyceps fumosorosea ARSEF 2679]OAA71643.1 DNA replication/checkpoint protein [Cordyceps fumosorosea ARSEF 2679]